MTRERLRAMRHRGFLPARPVTGALRVRLRHASTTVEVRNCVEGSRDRRAGVDRTARFFLTLAHELARQHTTDSTGYCALLPPHAYAYAYACITAWLLSHTCTCSTFALLARWIAHSRFPAAECAHECALPGLTMPAHTCFGYERVGIALTREGRPSLPDRRGEAATVRSPTFRPALSRVRLVSRVHEAAQPEGIRHHCLSTDRSNMTVFSSTLLQVQHQTIIRENSCQNRRRSAPSDVTAIFICTLKLQLGRGAARRSAF